MRELVISLDAVAALAEAAGRGSFDLGAAATLVELAGADAVRVGLREELRPVGEADVQHLRRVARGLELRVTPSPGLLKPALEARPDRVVIGGDGFELALRSHPIDLRTQASTVQGMLRSLGDAGIPAVLLIPPGLDAVKAAHSLGATGVEIFTGSTLDLPRRERAGALELLGDAARLAKKLRLELSLGGGIDAASALELLEIVPSAERIVIGRAALARGLLVGLDRSVRDLRARIL